VKELPSKKIPSREIHARARARARVCVCVSVYE